MATPIHLADLAVVVEALLPASDGPTHGDWRVTRAYGPAAAPRTGAWVAFRVDPRVVATADDLTAAAALATAGAAHDGVRAWAFDTVNRLGPSSWRPLEQAAST